jgi:hypothetical protein
LSTRAYQEDKKASAKAGKRVDSGTYIACWYRYYYLLEKA